MISIILTTTVNVTKYTSFQINKQERINCYIKSVKQWLELTNFNIILVENSGYLFEELKNELSNRFEIITFTEQQTNELHLQSKGGLEINSIQYAYNNSNILKNSMFIIKVTGRFFIPEFSNYLNNINLINYDCLRQNFKTRCEIVGAHITKFNNIFNKNLFIENGIYCYHVEEVYDYRFTLCKDILICPIFNIEPTQRGGLDEIYNNL